MIPTKRVRTHPGKILYEHYLKPKRITLRKLGQAINEKPLDLSDFVHGKTSVTSELATKLALCFNTSEDLWINLQRNYNESIFTTPKITKHKLGQILDTVRLNQCGWEAGEDIMTFNGKPIGGTIPRNVAIDRWWPDLKRHLVELLFDELNKKKK